MDVVDLLRKEYDVKGTALNHSNPLELLVATILSAQTTDKRVNIVTEELFKKYRKAEDYANADIEELRKAIKSVNFYRNKAKYIKESCRIIVEEYGGKVPDSMEELLKLPGVHRKTANVVLSNAFSKIEGIVVDTHVMRLSQRLGLTKEKNRERIKQELMKKFSKDKWADLSNLLIAHGRKVCRARKPECEKCILKDRCLFTFPYFRDVDIDEEIREIEEEIKNTKYNKATQHHIGKLKAKLARLRDEKMKQKGGKGGAGFGIKKTGDATVGMIGFPSVGKSTLLNLLTNAESKIGSYDFTTTSVIPGVMEYGGCKIQLLDLPGIISGASEGRGEGRKIISIARVVDLILIMVDAGDLSQLDFIKEELRNAGIRLNQRPPDVTIKKKDRGGISIWMRKNS